jgi:hypothetical protein
MYAKLTVQSVYQSALTTDSFVKLAQIIAQHALIPSRIVHLVWSLLALVSIKMSAYRLVLMALPQYPDSVRIAYHHV